MAESGKDIGDFLGIKPIAKSIEYTVKGFGGFIGRICLPAAEEYGQYLKDRVNLYRVANVAAVEVKAEAKQLEMNPGDGLHAAPRLVHTILNEASWIEDSEVQDMWAGLLSSSCTEDGDDDSNLLFTNLLSQLTKLQARIVNFACERSTKRVASNGLLDTDRYTYIDVVDLCNATGEVNEHRLDCEMDHLRNLGLISDGSGFHLGSTQLTAFLDPTPLALQMYVRCQGSRKSPIEFFGLTLEAKSVEPKQSPDSSATT
jgi:hypothetical protein